MIPARFRPKAAVACWLLPILLSTSCGVSFDPREVTELSGPREAPAHFRARNLRFSGMPRTDLGGVASWPAPGSPTAPANRGRLYRHVVPVVPEGWASPEPVPLWISSPSTTEFVDGWMAEVRERVPLGVTARVVDHAGREPGMRKESAWQKAIQQAEERFGIASHPRAPIVSWEPEEEWEPSF